MLVRCACEGEEIVLCGKEMYAETSRVLLLLAKSLIVRVPMLPSKVAERGTRLAQSPPAPPEVSNHRSHTQH